ncbi:MAG: glycosyltransferase [Pseudomonadota bacterium]
MSAASQPVVSIIVVSYNTADMTAACLRSIAAQTQGLAHEVIVVDNASTDGTADWLAAQSEPRLTILRNAVNTGGAGGFSRGLLAMRDEIQPDWCLLMDDDARPEPGALAQFRALLIDPAADAYAADVRYPDGRICDMNRPLRNPFAGFSFRQGFRVPDSAHSPSAAAQPIDMASFVGLFLSRKALAAVPPPDARLFLYGDDLLYTLAGTQAGTRLLFAPAIRFEHDCTTLAAGEKIYRPLWKIYYHRRNAVFLYRQAAGVLAWPLLALRLARWWAETRAYAPEERADVRRLLRAAVWDGIRGRLEPVPDGVPSPGG